MRRIVITVLIKYNIDRNFWQFFQKRRIKNKPLVKFFHSIPKMNRERKKKINQTICSIENHIHRCLLTIKTESVSKRPLCLFYLLFSFYIKRKKRKKHYQKIIKNGWNRLRTRAKSVEELGGWKNDNRVERHDRGQKKKKKGGDSQRGNRTENIRSYYRHPIKEEGGGRRAAGIVPMVYIYRLKSSFPYPFPLLLLCLVRLCARVHDKNWKVSFCTAFDFFSREKNFPENIRSFHVTCSMITDRCYWSIFERSSNDCNTYT